MASRSTASPEPGQPGRRRRPPSLDGGGPPPASSPPSTERRRRDPLAAPPAPSPVAPPVPVGPASPPVEVPARRRAVFGLAAEAAAQAERRRNGLDPREPPRVPRRRVVPPAVAARDGDAAPQPVVGVCPCGLPARARCADGCGRPTCGEHLLNGGSRLAAGGHRSEREHTVYVRAFSGGATPRCAWCRAQAGDAAVAALGPVAPLPADAVERLRELARRPHDHPGDAWDASVRRLGGPAAVVRLLAPKLVQRRPTVEFDGRRRGEVLAGVAITRSGPRGACEVVDGAGGVWSVRTVDAGVVRRRQAWAWDRVPEERVAAVLGRIVELASP